MTIDELEKAWNAEPRENAWEELGLDEIVAFAQEVEREAIWNEINSHIGGIDELKKETEEIEWSLLESGELIGIQYVPTENVDIFEYQGPMEKFQNLDDTSKCK